LKILFSNPPWWGKQDWQQFNDWETGKLKREYRYYQGVRAGSRWPSQFLDQSSPDNFIFKDYLIFPYFMAYAVSYLKQNSDHYVVLRDSIARKESYKSYFNYLKENKFDYIFIESSTPSYENDKELIQQIQRLFPNTKIVLTGTIAVKGAEILSDLNIHAVIKGEYEKGALKVVNGDSGVIDFDFLTEEEMNNAPLPYFEEEVINRYYNNRPLGHKYPQAQLLSSRGCPYKCIFCAWPATMTSNDPDGTRVRNVRYYNKGYMFKLLKEFKDRGFKSLLFDDDTFNLGDKHTLEMCEVLKDIGIQWSAMCRLDTISLDTWEIMKKSGCFGVSVGFESGNQWVVDNIVNKNLNLTKALEVAKHIKKLGMTIHATFTIGLPGETKEQMQDTLNFIEKNSEYFDSYQLSGTAEIEGTPMENINQKKYKAANKDANYLKEIDGKKKINELLKDTN